MRKVAKIPLHLYSADRSIFNYKSTALLCCSSDVINHSAWPLCPCWERFIRSNFSNRLWNAHPADSKYWFRLNGTNWMFRQAERLADIEKFIELDRAWHWLFWNWIRGRRNMLSITFSMIVRYSTFYDLYFNI